MRSEYIGVCHCHFLRICDRIRTALQAWNRNNVSAELGTVSQNIRKATCNTGSLYFFTSKREIDMLHYKVKYKHHIIENLRLFEAYRAGYLTFAEYSTHYLWMMEKKEERISITFVYVDGEYKGVSTIKEKLENIVNKFKID